MNIMRLSMTKNLLCCVQFINKIKKSKEFVLYSNFTVEVLSNNNIDRNMTRNQRHEVIENVQYYTSTNSKNNTTASMSSSEIDELFTELLSKNKDKQIIDLLKDCITSQKYINFTTLKKLFQYYSHQGKPDVIVTLQNYCSKINLNTYQRNGEFLHYLAIAQCMKGNSEKGLSIIKNSYSKYESLRGVYRITLRELIQDSVLNRSEASLMTFKKYVLEFSQEWSDHYPLVCFWHMCWASSWFSDQMLSNELLEGSEVLQNIVKDKATAFSMTTLKDYNEDAVVRLLQTLLKYDMMSEYVAVLQVLFNYKLKNKDISGCTEIIKNCEVLGVTLPSHQQGRYITMLIKDKKRDEECTSTKPTFKNFKLKF